jgi:hypothetical protein
MNTRVIYLMTFILAVSLAGQLEAQTANWTDGDTSNSFWSSPDNWDEYPSTDGYWVKIVNGETGATLNTPGEICLKMHVGGDLTFTVVDGGSLSMPQDLVVSRSGVGTFDMQGGLIDIGRDFEFGYDNPATVNMTGGTINVTRDVELPKTGNGQTGHMNLHGGTLVINRNLLMTEGGTMDIRGGILLLNSDAISDIQGYVDNGWITAYDGNGTIEIDYDVTNEGQTTITAVHRLRPTPIDGGLTPAGQTALSWTLPDPCQPGQPVPVDVYFTDDYDALWYFTNPDAIRVVSHNNVTSVNVQTVAKTRYYWAVDTYIGDPNDPILGPIFSFTADNVPPEVDAGRDALTWLDNGSVEVAISAVITDLDPTTSQWTVVSEPDDPNSPDALILDPTATSTTVILSALGEYVLQLEADDGEKQGADTLTISVYADQCEAAKSQPDWQALPGDINLDCVVDQADLDILLEHFLNCNALDCAGN